MVPPDFATLSGLSALVRHYDAFIIDLWGVLHDGAAAYPHAVETLQQFQKTGKPTILLSNAPRRTRDLVQGMQRMGLHRSLYSEIMSSGEAVNFEMRSRRDPFYAALGQHCWHLGPDRDRSVFESLDVELVTTPEEAAFMVNTGPWAIHETVVDYETYLLRCRQRDLPMVCANPDYVVVLREGQRAMCAGALAARYEELGGRVSYRGKPDPAIYDMCLECLGQPDRCKVLAVGDTLETDVAGAMNAGIDSALVTCGVHGGELGVGYNEQAEPGRVATLLARHDLRCRAILPAFVW
ncbi:HAD superfamily protein involved in N-acetyl-glucosamine catabolism [invertebrate metagenome]|uniref:HAD superfamily protein involved in N-acetyl-glucosamine catabolism n=1 Tax=invertebrate metagenome TaxID=1711999 RepID=A0A484H6G0_9ZZZZ